MEALQDDRLVRSCGHNYEIGSASLSNTIRAWVIERAARKQAQAEALRQVEQMRNSALRGLLGGAIGFGLAYLIAFMSQINLKSLLTYTTALRLLPGGLAGLLMLLWVDVAIASYRGTRRWMRWLTSALAGAFAFALAFSFHRMLQSQKLVDLLLAGLQGGIWGSVAGISIIATLTSKRPRWQSYPLAIMLGGVSLWLSNSIGNVFGSPTSPMLIGVSGMIMLLCLLVVAGWSDKESL